MQKAFEKIIEKVKEEYDEVNPYVSRHVTKIVNQVAEEYKSTEHINCSTDDLISRSALLGAMDKRYKEKEGNVLDNLAEGFMQMEKLIKEQPTVSVNDGWIPCEERLPIGADYKKRIDGLNYYKYVLVSTNESNTPIFVAWYNQEDETWYDIAGFVCHIIAWRELPQPYVKGE